MVWNPSRPADSDKIRISASLIRDNWQAIEVGTVPYDTISLQNQVSFPALPNHNRLYGYTNPTSGQVELCSVNPADQIVLLTEGGKIGSVNQNAIFNDVTMNAASMTSFTLGSIQNTQASFCTAWVTFESNGAILQSYNVASITKGATGFYRINLPFTLSTKDYCVVGMAYESNSTNTTRVMMATAQTTSSVTIRIQRTNQSGSYEDSAGYVAMFGGR